MDIINDMENTLNKSNTREAADTEVLPDNEKRVKPSKDEKNKREDAKSEDEYKAAFEPFENTDIGKFLGELGNSPVVLTNAKVNKIKATFPIPREQFLFWADAEFDLRPSGIVATNRGVYIHTDAGAIKRKTKIRTSDLEKMSEEEQEKYKLNIEQFHSGTSSLLYYSWDNFMPDWFTADNEVENRAMLVDPKCYQKFVEVCRKYARKNKNDSANIYDLKLEDDTTKNADYVGITTAAAVESAQSAVFVEQKSAVNEKAGHGEMAEEANTLLDKLHGMNSKVIGRDNAKDGADRITDGVFIQSKYYKSATGSLDACFNPETGQYRYMQDGKPMQLEVPKDQYEKVLKGFERKIEDGKVPGISDPKEAEQIVRKGRLTYNQAVNLTKPGTIESLTYDALTGAVICSCAMGLTFVVTVFLTWRKTGDLKQAIQAGAVAGLQIFGISFIQHMLISQIARTSLANSLLAPSQYVVGKLGYHASAVIVNGIRTLAGKKAIYGIAASKHLAKILRSNVLTSALTFAVFSIPETYNAASKKISGAQYVKNMSTLVGSIAGGAGGAIAAGLAAAKVAAVAGTTVAPGVGTVIGIAGGFVGGVAGSTVVKKTGDILHEDDAVILGRMFNSYVSCMIGEYLLDESEIDDLISALDEIKSKDFKNLFGDLAKSQEQENLLRAFLMPYFENITQNRPKFVLPTSEEMLETLLEFAQ